MGILRAHRGGLASVFAWRGLTHPGFGCALSRLVPGSGGTRMSVTAMPARRMSEAEWQTRLDLAACYRLIDLFGWSDLINTRITARVPGAHDHFLINRFGMLYDEITASSLVKIDIDGNKVEPSDDEVNRGGFAIPSTIHMARPDINCVIHTNTVAGCAVWMHKGGLLS